MSLGDRDFKHVEFIGMPGAGKSYHHIEAFKGFDKKIDKSIEEAAKRELASGYPNYLFLDRAWRRILWYNHKISAKNVHKFNSFTAKNTMLLSNGLEALEKRNASVNEREKAIDNNFWLYSNYETLLDTNYKGKLHLDEGFCQNSVRWFVDETGILEDIAREYLKNVPTPNIIFKINNTVSRSMNNIEKRNSGFPKRLTGRDKKEKKEFLRNVDRYSDLVAGLMENKGTKVIEINNKHDYSSIEQVIRELNSL